MLYNGHVFTNDRGETFKRINKTEARNRAARGESIGVCACKLNPVNKYYSNLAWYHAEEHPVFADGNGFDAFVNSYEYYNCNPEWGNYAAFYVEV